MYLFEEKKVKLEETNFRDMDMPDSIDIGEDGIVRAFKQEKFIIKSKIEDSCQDYANQEEIGLDIIQRLGSTSKSWDDSTIVTNSSCREHDSETKYENHRKQYKGVGVLSRGDCDYQSNNKHRLLQHESATKKVTINHKACILLHKPATEIQMFTCRECDFQTKHKQNLKTHCLRHKTATQTEIFSCAECDYQTKNKSHLRRHQLRHRSATEVEMFTCGDCNYRTKFKWDLISHMRRHKTATEIDMFSCGECDFQTKYKSNLKNHRLQHKSATETEMFSCNECDHQTMYKWHLKRHMLRHKIQFCCEECDYQAKTKYQLERHNCCHRSALETFGFGNSDYRTRFEQNQSEESLKVEYPKEDVFDETKIGIKLEKTYFNDMQIPDSIDSEDFDVKPIKLEDLVKSEIGDLCKDNM